MGTDCSQQSPTRSPLYSKLFETLAIHRNAGYARFMAKALVMKNSTSDPLVALVDDCERAVYYSLTGRTLKTYAIGKHGVVEADVDTLWQSICDVKSWGDVHYEECDWLQPVFK